MAPRVKVRAIRALNKLSDVYKGIIRKRKIPSVIARKHIIRPFCKLKDTISVIRQLL